MHIKQDISLNTSVGKKSEEFSLYVIWEYDTVRKVTESNHLPQ